MIRHLHPTDSPGLLQFSQSSGQGETCTLVGALRGGPGGFPTVKYAGIALSPRAWQSCWVEARRGRIDALLRAGPRSGPQAWEVGELYLRKSKTQLAVDLFEQIAIPAGGAGAHRIFARVPVDGRGANDSVYEYARNAGFSTICRETVYRCESAHSAINKLGIPDHSLQLRPRTELDTLALFQLYNATTPIEARMKSGQTSQDWAAGVERLGRKAPEWIFELPDGSIGAHVKRGTTRSGLWMLLADEQDRVRIAEALRRAQEHGNREDLITRLWAVIGSLRPKCDDRWDMARERIVELNEVGEGIDLSQAAWHAEDPKIGDVVGVPVDHSHHVHTLVWRWLSEAYPGLAEYHNTLH